MKIHAWVLFVFSILTVEGWAAFDHSHKAWTQILSEFQTTDGLVRYKALKASVKANPKQHKLIQYLASLSAVKKAEYDKWSRNNKMAFLINAYNAFTVKLIIDSHPVKSIKDTVGFFRSPWKKEFFSLLDGKIKQLDPIEHEWLRPKFNNALVHAAVNCASISCPRLHPTAFEGSKLDQQLQFAFKEFLNDSSRNRYDKEKGILYISKIFDWFEEDFEKNFGSVKKTFAKFGPPLAQQALKKRGKIRYLDYDWGLNEAKDSPAIAKKKKK